MPALSLSTKWKDLSISKKLYTVVGIMTVLVLSELLTLNYAMHKFSAMRAFIEGESLWSKAQKNAVINLQRYVISRKEAAYQAFQEDLRIPIGDHNARVSLLGPHPDVEAAHRGFAEGKVAEADIPGMIELLRNLYWVSYIKRATETWAEADDNLAELMKNAANYRAKILAREKLDPEEAFARITETNEKLTRVEVRFSSVLGDSARQGERFVFILLFTSVLMADGIGLALTFLTSRALSSGLRDMENAAARIGQGDYATKIAIKSRDEIGKVGLAINKMGQLLSETYNELENRVQARTLELRNLAEENARLYTEAQDALYHRDEFLSIASHELKTPITSLALQVQLLARLAKSPDNQNRLSDLAAKSLRHSMQLAELVDTLLDLTKIRAGKFELHRKTCDIGALIRDTSSLFATESIRQGCEIKIELEEPLMANFDPLRITQILRNLISNALKYAPGKPVLISAGTREGGILIRIADSGPGIPAAEQNAIFEQFQRGESHSGISGLGLGLYITRQIAVAHGGEVYVESEQGEGATFIVKLPLSNWPL
ncbi:MAG: HAMP domain-containing sensor histidine kinase [Oligoflexia bacterium]|nr:HAMP domain-containing sensor histidine kinase [Oligoflexia bacterium]